LEGSLRPRHHQSPSTTPFFGMHIFRLVLFDFSFLLWNKKIQGESQKIGIIRAY
jgi:hypothetical protein